MADYENMPFQIPPSPISSEEFKETYNTEVAIDGAGTSDKAAAFLTAKAGVEVIQIDMYVTFRWSGGMIGTVKDATQAGFSPYKSVVLFAGRL